MNKSPSDIASFCYIPYSARVEFCYVSGKSGISYPGVRIENGAFPLTIPAVQGALCSCLANNDTPVGIIEKTSGKKKSRFWVDKFELEELKSIPEHKSVYKPLNKNVDNIRNILKSLCKKSVSGESNFPVTALLKVKGGYISGVNVEFEEWNLGLCAERVALSRALASGYREFLGMYIYAPKSDFISPCGACRQVLFEHMPDQMVESHHGDHTLSRHLVSHLLPHGFTSNSLKK